MLFNTILLISFRFLDRSAYSLLASCALALARAAAAIDAFCTARRLIGLSWRADKASVIAFGFIPLAANAQEKRSQTPSTQEDETS